MLPKDVVPIIGQECICPDGLGRVSDYLSIKNEVQWVKVTTYFENRSCKWDIKNITLIKLNTIEAE